MAPSAALQRSQPVSQHPFGHPRRGRDLVERDLRRCSRPSQRSDPDSGFGVAELHALILDQTQITTPKTHTERNSPSTTRPSNTVRESDDGIRAGAVPMREQCPRCGLSPDRRHGLAEHPSASADLLKVLSGDEGHETRERVAANPSAKQDTTRGEHAARGELSLCVRGAAIKALASPRQLRAIPACAGSGDRSSGIAPTAPSHPCVCGERPGNGLAHFLWYGSSLRVRGTAIE